MHGCRRLFKNVDGEQFGALNPALFRCLGGFSALLAIQNAALGHSRHSAAISMSGSTTGRTVIRILTIRRLPSELTLIVRPYLPCPKLQFLCYVEESKLKHSCLRTKDSTS